MLVSNGKAKERIDFFHELSKYKKVDSGGKYLNNINRSIDNKMDFIKDYKFVISFENSSSPGYTTEKLIEPMYANAIPLYWGNPAVHKDFNVNSFINIQSPADYGDAINQIIELDTNDDKYMQMVEQPWFNNNQMPTEMRQESLTEFLAFVIKDSKTKKPVAKSFAKNSMHKIWLIKEKIKGTIMFRLGIKKGFR